MYAFNNKETLSVNFILMYNLFYFFFIKYEFKSRFKLSPVFIFILRNE